MENIENMENTKSIKNNKNNKNSKNNKNNSITANGMNLIYEVQEDISINDVLTNIFHLSIRLKNKLINSKNVLLNGTFVDTRTIAHLQDLITIALDYEEDNSNIIPTKMDLKIVYEDDFLLAINKSAGMPVHPSILHFEDSLSNGVKYYYDLIGLKKKIRPVNRIDLNTSGLVLFAKNEYIQEQLIKEMKNNEFKKTYLAIVCGKLDKKDGIIDFPISRKENSIIERCISQNGQNAITYFSILKEYDNYSLVECILETGRTHQIRVHFSYLGHPLLGDSLYGNKLDLINRQALHSYKIKFIHPVNNKKIKLLANIPEDIKKLLK